MNYSWDIVVWTQENTIIDYVPSSWANDARTKYKYPFGKNSLKIRRLIDGNMALDDEGQFEWLDAVCKAQCIKDLQMAKELCEKGTYTSNFEITDQESSLDAKKKRKRVRRPFNDNEQDSSSDENLPLARGQNLIRKVFSTQKVSQCK